jgi:molecular chaperone HtpG
MDRWSSLNDYVGRMKPDQKKIYYIIGDDDRSVTYSPHLDVVRHYDYEVLAMTDPIDAFMLVRLNEYEGFEVVNVANADLKLPEKVSDTETSDSGEEAEGESINNLIERVKSILGERVADVRTTDRLSQSPARLVDPEDAPNQEMQRVYRMLERDYEIPKKVLELNPGHIIVRRLSEIPEEDELSRALIEQLYENALLIEGLHPDPAGMIKRLHKIMEAALEHPNE